MKKLTLALLFCLPGLFAVAQNRNEPPVRETKKKERIVRPVHCPKLYITTSSGINNNTGVIGFNFDVPVGPEISLDLGVGTGTWGTKLYAGGKYYLEPCHRGWAFGTGITYSSGLTNFHQNLETIYYNSEEVVLDLNPQTNILFAAYRYWNLGRRYNRVYLELGYSAALSGGDKYTEVAGNPLTNNSDKVMRLLAPGGLIIACGFSFGVH